MFVTKELENRIVFERGKECVNLEENIVTVVGAEDNTGTEIHIELVTGNPQNIKVHHVCRDIKAVLLGKVALTEETLQTGIHNTDNTWKTGTGLVKDPNRKEILRYLIGRRRPVDEKVKDKERIEFGYLHVR